MAVGYVAVRRPYRQNFADFSGACRTMLRCHNFDIAMQ
jgi:hypothetical protein